MIGLAGDENQLDGYYLALAVFGRDASFESGLDPIVRVQVGRLRDRVAQYYAEEGAANVLRIDIPKGTYIPAAYERARAPIVATTRSKLSYSTVMVFPFEFRGRATDLCNPCVFAITDELIYLLTQAQGIRVASRISVAQLDPTLDVRLAGQQFGAQFIVAGVLTHLGDECHIIVHLSRTADGYNIWSNRYSVRPHNLINTSEAIVSALTGEIGRIR